MLLGRSGPICFRVWMAHFPFSTRLQATSEMRRIAVFGLFVVVAPLLAMAGALVGGLCGPFFLIRGVWRGGAGMVATRCAPSEEAPPPPSKESFSPLSQVEVHRHRFIGARKLVLKSPMLTASVTQQRTADCHRVMKTSTSNRVRHWTRIKVLSRKNRRDVPLLFLEAHSLRAIVAQM